MPVRTVVVRCPDWPVRSAMAAAGVDPEGAEDIPAAVVFANRVVSTTPAARAEGVRRGLRRREAQSRCPRLVVLPPDPARDARAFEPVVAAVAELAPGVEVTRPGVCAVAARGPGAISGATARSPTGWPGSSPNAPRRSPWSGSPTAGSPPRWPPSSTRWSRAAARPRLPRAVPGGDPDRPRPGRRAAPPRRAYARRVRGAAAGGRAGPVRPGRCPRPPARPRPGRPAARRPTAPRS